MRQDITIPHDVVFTVADFARTFHIGRNLAYELVRTGEVKSIRLGTRRILIPSSEVRRLLLESNESRVAGLSRASSESATEDR